MDVKKEQQIIVFTTLTDSDKNLVLCGIKLARIFKKELCLVYHLKRSERKNRMYLTLKLTKQLESLNHEVSSMKTSVLLTEGNLKNLPEKLADDYEAILLVASNADYKKYSQAVINSPIPFLFTNPTFPISAFQRIVLPIDLRRENSDTALWCSWFGRFGNSEITAVAANENGHDSKRLVAQNVLLAKKLFHKTGVVHKFFKGRRSSLNNSFEAMDYALDSESDLLVLLGSSVITPLDWLLGLPERKIIARAGQLPVLLVNPRRDNYILCD